MLLVGDDFSKWKYYNMRKKKSFVTQKISYYLFIKD